MAMKSTFSFINREVELDNCNGPVLKPTTSSTMAKSHEVKTQINQLKSGHTHSELIEGETKSIIVPLDVAEDQN